jgi:hypothetical protein
VNPAQNDPGPRHPRPDPFPALTAEEEAAWKARMKAGHEAGAEAPAQAVDAHRQEPGTPGWYERATAGEPARQAARETELRHSGRSAPQAAAIAGTEATQREWEREERGALLAWKPRNRYN